MGRAFSNAGTEIGLCSIPGMCGTGGGPGPGQPFGGYWPSRIDSELVPMEVVVDGKLTVVDNTPYEETGNISISLPESPDVASGPTRHAPLGALFGTRSGDKGPNANLGVFARTPDAFAWLSGYLTVDKLKELMPEAEESNIDRLPLLSIDIFLKTYKQCHSI